MGCIQESGCSCLIVTFFKVCGSCHLRLRCTMLKKLSRSKATMPGSPWNLCVTSKSKVSVLAVRKCPHTGNQTLDRYKPAMSDRNSIRGSCH